jgi:anti-anti-sigma regulatory factor
MTTFLRGRRNDQRQRQRLSITCIIIGAAALLDIPLLILEGNTQLLSITAGLLVVDIAAFILARKGMSVIGGWLLSLGLLVATLIALPINTLNQPIMLVYVIPLLVAGFVVSSQAVILTGILLILTLAARLLTQNNDLPAAIVIGLFSLITGLLWIILRELEHSLERANKSTEEAELARSETAAQHEKTMQSNQELQTAYTQQQQLLDTIQELETPIMPLNDNLLIVPLIGHVDSRRAQNINERVLGAVHAQRSAFVILDISGVTVVDTQVAQHIHQLIQSLKLLGASVTVTGIKPEVATTMIGLGIDFGAAETAGSLQEGFQRISLQDHSWRRFN